MNEIVNLHTNKTQLYGITKDWMSHWCFQKQLFVPAIVCLLAKQGIKRKKKFNRCIEGHVCVAFS